jgi:hypothetical protein
MLRDLPSRMVGVEALDDTRTRDIANILTIPLLWPMEEIAHILGEWQQHISRGAGPQYSMLRPSSTKILLWWISVTLTAKSASGRRGGSNHPLVTVPFGGGICTELV